MRTADKYPDFREAWIVIDDRNAPSLRHAIGCRIYKTARGAAAKLAEVKRGRSDAEHLWAIPVEGKNYAERHGVKVFSLDYIDAEGVTVRPDGTIRLEGGTR